MSIDAISAASKQNIPPRDKFVLVALCDHYNDDKQVAWMKQSTLAQWTNYTRATVNAALTALEHEHGLIITEQRRYADGRNASKVYKLTRKFWDAWIEATASRVNAVDTGAAESTALTRTESTALTRTESTALTTRTVNLEPLTKNRYKPPTPLKDSSKQNSKTEKFDALLADLPGDVPPDLWADFVAHRSEIRKPLTPTATKRLLSRLEEFGPNAATALRDSIANGWTGVFPPKEEKPELTRKSGNQADARAAQAATDLLTAIRSRRDA